MSTARIHPTAIISPEAELADDVQVGPYAVLEGRVRIGAGCVIKAHTTLCGPLTMGKNNIVYPGAVLGERPQHFRYNDEPTGVEIGDHNVFREHVTVHRGTTQSWTTRIGHHNYFMANAHVAHDCQVGNHCIICNGALLGGHCVIEDQVFLSGNSAVHQFARIGRLALLSGCSASSKDMAPFTVQQNINIVVGINLIGMRRAGMTSEHILDVKKAFRIIFRQGKLLSAAVAEVEQELGHSPPVADLIRFIRQSSRGISVMDDRNRPAAA